MKILHTLKSGKVNEIPLDNRTFKTRHKVKGSEVMHEGWTVEGDFTEKEHKYKLLFSPEEARDFYNFLGKMLNRFEDDELSFIADEEHEE